MSDVPIEGYAMVSDCQTAALISTGGSVDWLCMPCFDARSVLGRLLDAEAGHWSIRPGRPSRPGVPTGTARWCCGPTSGRMPEA
ncbi:hypothetical protein GCM10025734_18270 [Kitasatospora paranensis]|uniref:trehalase-like domain-containing protein n=1 Tax=Kitasatospora paranensis TaxID=258053 RepID=UPI0031F0B93E